MQDKIVPEYVRNHVKIALSHPHAQTLNISVLKMSLKSQMIAHPMIYAFLLGANVGYFQSSNEKLNVIKSHDSDEKYLYISLLTVIYFDA